MNQEALRDAVTQLKPKRSLSFIQPLDVDDGGQRSVRKVQKTHFRNHTRQTVRCTDHKNCTNLLSFFVSPHFPIGISNITFRLGKGQHLFRVEL